MNMLKITEISETQFLSMIRDVCLPTFSDVSTSLEFPESIKYDQISTIIDQKILLLIDELEDIYKEDSSYQSLIKGLKDNVEYMKRVIRFSNATITPEMFNMKKNDIDAFVKSYYRLPMPASRILNL